MSPRRFVRFITAAALLGSAAAAAEHRVVIRPAEDVEGCRAHVAASDGTAGRSTRCGESLAFDPAADSVAWIETADAITPFTTPLSASTAEALTLDPLVRSGAIFFRNHDTPAEREHLRVVRIGDHRFESEWRPLFDRPVPRGEVLTPLAVPAGDVVALIVDGRGDVVALSPSARVPADGQETVEWPRRPRSGADLVVILDRPRTPAADRPDLVAVALEVGSQRRRPDHVANGADRLMAIWRGVDARSGRLVAESDRLWMPSHEVTLRARQVTTIRSSLRVLPRLEVGVATLPAEAEGLDVPEMTLTIRRVSDGTALRQQVVEAGKSYSFDSLPAELLDATLQIGEWKILKKADLSGGDDGSIDFALVPIVVRGTVFYGDNPAPAEISFHQFDKWIEIASADDGRYSIVLWQPRHYFIDVRVRSRGARAPFREAVMLTKSRTLDFRVPMTALAVRVTNATDGAPVAGALVSARNEWRDAARGQQAQVLPVRTDDNGTADLPPLRPGTVDLTVTAEGFYPEERVGLSVEDSPVLRTLDIVLRPLGESQRVRFRLPGGAPAAGAEIVAVRLSDMKSLWRGTSRGDGSVDLPRSLSGSLILVRHAAAGGIVVPWSIDTPPTWQLPRAAPPVSVRVRRARSEEPVQARVVIWMSGVALHGPHLAFLAWSAPSSGADGVWVAKNLPPEPLEVAAVSLRRPVGAMPENVLRAMATVVAFPWPRNAVVDLLE